MKKVLWIGAFVAASACAKKPDQIAAADIGGNEYNRYSCQQLAETRLKYEQALTSLSAEQKSAAAGDAWGVFLFGLPMSSMSGNDKETNIAVTKGHLNSIDQARTKKGC